MGSSVATHSSNFLEGLSSWQPAWCNGMATCNGLREISEGMSTLATAFYDTVNSSVIAKMGLHFHQGEKFKERPRAHPMRTHPKDEFWQRLLQIAERTVSNRKTLQNWGFGLSHQAHDEKKVDFVKKNGLKTRGRSIFKNLRPRNTGSKRNDVCFWVSGIPLLRRGSFTPSSLGSPDALQALPPRQGFCLTLWHFCPPRLP